jgi:hypothetical protein
VGWITSITDRVLRKNVTSGSELERSEARRQERRKSCKRLCKHERVGKAGTDLSHGSPRPISRRDPGAGYFRLPARVARRLAPRGFDLVAHEEAEAMRVYLEAERDRIDVILIDRHLAA